MNSEVSHIKTFVNISFLGVQTIGGWLVLLAGPHSKHTSHYHPATVYALGSV